MDRRPTTWNEVARVVARTSPDSCAMECPRCGRMTIRYQYVGDIESRIGFLMVWCDSCFHGTHLSRVKAPATVHMIPMDAQGAVIPKYTLDGEGGTIL